MDTSRRLGNLYTNDSLVTSTHCPKGLTTWVPFLHPPLAHGSFCAQTQGHRFLGRAVQFQPWVGVCGTGQRELAVLTMRPFPLRRAHRTKQEHALVNVQFSSVAQSCPTLCNPMDRSTPGFLVHHQLLELAQTPIH